MPFCSTKGCHNYVHQHLNPNGVCRDHEPRFCAKCGKKLDRRNHSGVCFACQRGEIEPAAVMDARYAETMRYGSELLLRAIVATGKVHSLKVCA